MNDIFKPAGHPITHTRASFLKLIQPSRNTNYGQKHFLIWQQIFGTVYWFPKKQLRALTPTNTR